MPPRRRLFRLPAAALAGIVVAPLGPKAKPDNPLGTTPIQPFVPFSDRVAGLVATLKSDKGDNPFGSSTRSAPSHGRRAA